MMKGKEEEEGGRKKKKKKLLTVEAVNLPAWTTGLEIWGKVAMVEVLYIQGENSRSVSTCL